MKIRAAASRYKYGGNAFFFIKFPHRHAKWNRHRLIRIHISHLPVIISIIDLEWKLRDILRELHIDTYIVGGLITGISHIYIEIHDLGIVRGRGGLILAEGECYRLVSRKVWNLSNLISTGRYKHSAGSEKHGREQAGAISRKCTAADTQSGG